MRAPLIGLPKSIYYHVNKQLSKNSQPFFSKVGILLVAKTSIKIGFLGPRGDGTERLVPMATLPRKDCFPASNQWTDSGEKGRGGTGFE